MRSAIHSLTPRRLLAALLASAFMTIASAAGPERLDNGLTILLRPVVRAPDTALVVLFELGGDHDPPGRSGQAHVLEHLYVTAAAGETTARSATELIQSYPGGWNAQTGDRYIVIATVFPNTELDAELAEAAARMGDLRLTEADLAREQPRVLEEVGNMFAGLPQLAAVNNARELVRPTPRGGRKGGRPEHVQATRLDELRDQWRRYYKPANATLVLAGGFDSAEAERLIMERFGALPSGEPPPPPAAPGDPRFEQTARIESPAAAGPQSSATVCLTYPAPPPVDRLYAAYLVVLSRMHESAGGFLGLFGDGTRVIAPLLDDPAVVAVSAPIRKAETAEAAVARLDEFVANACHSEVRDVDAARVRRTFGTLFGFVPDDQQAANPYGIAFGAGRRHQLGLDPDALSQALDAVSSDDLQQIAEEVFTPERRAAAVVTLRTP